MTRSTLIRPSRPSCRGPNFLAILISFAAVSFLYFNFNPTPVGADASDGAISKLKANLATPPPPALPRSVVPVKRAQHTAPPGAPGSEPLAADRELQSPQASLAVPAGQGVLTGKMALLMHLLMLEKASNRLERIANYTATFFKQERVDGELSELQVMEIKLRHSPFSVYMKWIDGGDVGREILYVNGQNNGKLLVHVGGFRGRFLPSLSLNPNGSLAMEESRYPITKAGLLELVRMAISYRQRDLELSEHVKCHMIADHRFDDRECYCFTVEYDDPKTSAIYRKSITYFDKTLSVPIFIKNFTWPHRIQECDADALDESTVIEHYAFSNVNLGEQLADVDFDRKNNSYRLRR